MNIKSELWKISTVMNIYIFIPGELSELSEERLVGLNAEKYTTKMLTILSFIKRLDDRLPFMLTLYHQFVAKYCNETRR